MKVEIKNTEQNQESFWDDLPKLVISKETDCIILAVRKDGSQFKGICLQPGESANIPLEICETWACSRFVEFTGEVTLSN